jgi:hypothetical protein
MQLELKLKLIVMNKNSRIALSSYPYAPTLHMNIHSRLYHSDLEEEYARAEAGDDELYEQNYDQSNNYDDTHNNNDGDDAPPVPQWQQYLDEDNDNLATDDNDDGMFVTSVPDRYGRRGGGGGGGGGRGRGRARSGAGRDANNDSANESNSSSSGAQGRGRAGRDHIKQENNNENEHYDDNDAPSAARGRTRGRGRGRGGYTKHTPSYGNQGIKHENDNDDNNDNQQHSDNDNTVNAFDQLHNKRTGYAANRSSFGPVVKREPATPSTTPSSFVPSYRVSATLASATNNNGSLAKAEPSVKREEQKTPSLSFATSSSSSSRVIGSTSSTPFSLTSNNKRPSASAMLPSSSLSKASIQSPPSVSMKRARNIVISNFLVCQRLISFLMCISHVNRC